MVSNIDATLPTTGNAYTADMRSNFSAAKAEIEALQGSLGTLGPGPFLPTGGGTITGPVNFFNDPGARHRRPVHLQPLMGVGRAYE